jgi:lipoprotein-anchoring transpeptidase ErfK/SrfK
VRGFLEGAISVRRLAASAAIVLVAAFLATGVSGAMQPANAQQGFGNFFGYQTNKPVKRRARRTRNSEPTEQTAEKADAKKDEGPSGPVYVVVSIGDQRISVYDRTGRIASSRVSTGMRGHATPTGVFSVIGKSRYHRSNIYAGAPMPWMQRITWSGVAMHAGVVPGYPASHGCIRLPYSFAPQLYKMIHQSLIYQDRKCQFLQTL